MHSTYAKRLCSSCCQIEMTLKIKNPFIVRVSFIRSEFNSKFYSNLLSHSTVGWDGECFFAQDATNKWKSSKKCFNFQHTEYFASQSHSTMVFGHFMRWKNRLQAFFTVSHSKIRRVHINHELLFAHRCSHEKLLKANTNHEIML